MNEQPSNPVSDSLSRWRQCHDFEPPRAANAERRLHWVIAITLAAMAAELAGGYAFGSMALVADGWHMASHAAALGISVIGYAAARHFRGHAHFTFGTGKIGPLAGYSSALLLGLVAVLTAGQSAARLVHPEPVAFDDALLVAVLGLTVNLVCAWILRERSNHRAGEATHSAHQPARELHGTGMPGHAHDHNMAAAYLHVIADALTSLLAIAALVAGKHLGWTMLDPLTAIAGAILIMHWAWRLMQRSGRVLLDAEDNGPLTEQVRALLELDGTRVADLHVWRVSEDAHACIATLVAGRETSVGDYKARIADLRCIRHVTIEVNREICGASGEAPAPVGYLGAPTRTASVRR